MSKISEDLLNEVVKLSFRRKEVIRVIIEHLKYEYIEEPAYKELIKAICDFYKHQGEECPTIGYISSQFSRKEKNETKEKIRREILKILYQVKQIDTPKEDTVLLGLENYIKDAKFVLGYKKLGVAFNSGNKEEARKLMDQYGQELSNFNIIKSAEKFTLLYQNFRERIGKRKAFIKSKGLELFQAGHSKIPWGIYELDNLLGGGSNPAAGDLDGFLARSGAGKSFYARWRGVEASRLGHSVLHISLEETKDQTELKYDQTWSASLLQSLEEGDLPDELLQELDGIIENILEGGGEVAIDAHEEFGKMSVPQVIERIQHYEKTFGRLPKLVIIDYLELLDPGTGIFYKKDEERFRRLDIAEALRNASNSLKINIFAPTQADSIKMDQWNEPTFWMTRDNIAECKGLTKPFSNFVTWNCTLDEYEADRGRLFTDKLRGIKGNKLFEIATAFDHGRFYDHFTTMGKILNLK